jgi:hypothetical protein
MYKAILLPKVMYASVVWWPMMSRVEANPSGQSPEGCGRVCDVMGCGGVFTVLVT